MARKWKGRIALVGNGPISNDCSNDIDAHHFVIRFNSCPNYGDTGYRTDILVLTNTGPPARGFAYGQSPIGSRALASTRKVWFTYSPELVATASVGSDPETWTEYSREIVARHNFEGRWRYLDPQIYWAAQSKLSNLGAAAYSRPSSGMLTLFHIRKHFRWPRVTLYGFTHEGWPGHPWQAEKSLIESVWSHWVTKTVVN